MRKEIYNMLNPSLILFIEFYMLTWKIEETPSKALKRLCPNQKTIPKKGRKNMRKKNLSQQRDEYKQEIEKNEKKPAAKSTKEEDDEEEIIKNKYFNRLVQLCDYLSLSGYVDIYTDTKEEIKAKYFPDLKPKVLPAEPIIPVINNDNVASVEIKSEELEKNEPRKYEKTFLDELEDDLKD